MSYGPKEQVKARKRKSVEEVVISNKLVREDLTKKVTCTQKFEEGEKEVLQAKRRVSTKKDPEIGVNWVLLSPV